MEALLERTAISAFIRREEGFSTTGLFDADGRHGGRIERSHLWRHDEPGCFGTSPPDTMRGARSLLVQRLLRIAWSDLALETIRFLLAPVFSQRPALRLRDVLGAIFADIGRAAAARAPSSPDTTDIFQEGIIIPPTKLIDAGRTNEAALNIFHRKLAISGPEALADMRGADGKQRARRQGASRKILARVRRRGLFCGCAGQASLRRDASAGPRQARRGPLTTARIASPNAIDFGWTTATVRFASAFRADAGTRAPMARTGFIFDGTETDDQGAWPG